MTQRERCKKARQKWQRLVSEQARSGQSVAAFCRERRLCAPHFFAWKKRLREAVRREGSGASPGQFVEVKLAAAGPKEVQTTGLRRRAGDGRVEVVLKNGRRLWVGPGFDAGHVRALVAAVEGAA